MQADVRVRELQSERVVGTVRSSTDGRFQISLTAGQYELQVLNPADGSTAGPPQVVEVFPNKMTETTLQFDTGIR